MTTLTEAAHPGTFIIREAPFDHCRDNIVVAESQTIVVGEVLGRRISAAATVTSSVVADGSNTGNGVLTLDGSAPVAVGAQDGVYRAVCIAVATNGGEFEVVDPSGIELGRAAVGATFNNQIKFVVHDGTNDFAAGDAFSITVGIADTAYEYVALNLAATDGTQNAAGIAVYPITTSSSGNLAGLVRGPADVRGSDLTWPGGITAPQQAEGLRQLERLGIITR